MNLRHEFTSEYGHHYLVQGDPDAPETISVIRDGVDMSDDDDGAAICEADVLAELLKCAFLEEY